MKASDSVWALVSGLPSSERGRRLVMSLQAFFDDSGSDEGNEVFVLAGHIAPVEKWGRFSDEWQACLDKPPGAAFFKAKQAMQCNGEFAKEKGWTKELRNERIIELSDIIARNCSVAVSAVIRHDDFAATIKALPMLFGGRRTKGNNHPYLYLWYHLISEMWMHGPSLGLGGPCDFIFDRQRGFEGQALEFFNIMEDAMKQPPIPPWADWIGSPPIFRDDKCFRPLQAADLWAWANRRASVHEPDDLKLPLEAIELLCSVRARHLNFTRDVLRHDALKGLALMRRALSATEDESGA